MTIDEMITVLQAAKAGKELQIRPAGARPDEPWQRRTEPVWDFIYYDYRVKPEPREFWLADTGFSNTVVFTSYEAAKTYPENVKFIHVREVID